MTRRGLAITCALLIVPTCGLARTWYVISGGGGDAPTIQAGIDSAAAADTVLLADGLFTGDGNRDIDFKGKAITVRSENGNPDQCVIDCGGTSASPHSGFRFTTDEEPTAVLEAVTIRHAYAGSGAGVTCHQSAPTILFCNFLADTATALGGAMSISESSAAIVGCKFLENYSGTYGGAVQGSGPSTSFNSCTFIGNRAGYSGGGMHCSEGSVVLEGCTFSGNSALWGGGMSFWDGCVATLIGVVTHGNQGGFGGGALQCHLAAVSLDYCTFVADSCGSAGAGMYIDTGASPTVQRSIIAFGLNGVGLYCESLSDDPSVSCSCIYGNEMGDWVGCIADEDSVDGNICEDPLFCDIATEQFTVEACSPCLGICGTGAGAYESDCGCGEATEPTTWGRIKAEFGED